MAAPTATPTQNIPPIKPAASTTAPKIGNLPNAGFSYELKKEKKSSIDIDINAIKGAIINFIVPLICLGLTTAIFFIFLFPSYKAIPDLKIQLDEKNTLENQLKSKLSNLNRLVDFQSVVDENSSLVNKVLVSEAAVPALLTQIDNIAKNSGLQISKLNYSFGSAANESGPYDVVNVNLAVEGSFTQTVTFLKELENAARIINVDTVRYSIDSNEGALAMSSDFVLVSPYLYVESTAVTDEPVDLDISSAKFQSLIARLKNMKYYDASTLSVPPVATEVPAAEELPAQDGSTEEPAL